MALLRRWPIVYGFLLFLSRRGPSLTQLFFIDDLIQFAGATNSQCEVLNKVLEAFYKISR